MRLACGGDAPGGEVDDACVSFKRRLKAIISRFELVLGEWSWGGRHAAGCRENLVFRVNADLRVVVSVQSLQRSKQSGSHSSGNIRP